MALYHSLAKQHTNVSLSSCFLTSPCTIFVLQDVKNLEASQSQTINPYSEVSGLCRGMMLQTTALRTRVTQLEEEQRGLEQQISLKYRQCYDSLVRQLFSTCIQLKVRNAFKTYLFFNHNGNYLKPEGIMHYDVVRMHYKT